jgi:hypothetical protein
MTQVTIRKVENAWVEKAREEAVRRKVSMNQVLAEALRRGLGLDSQPVRRSNLDKFAGDSDFGSEWDDFLEKDLKQVDESLWS